jgi:hypothetical protein
MVYPRTTTDIPPLRAKTMVDCPILHVDNQIFTRLSWPR